MRLLLVCTPQSLALIASDISVPLGRSDAHPQRVAVSPGMISSVSSVNYIPNDLNKSTRQTTHTHYIDSPCAFHSPSVACACVLAAYRYLRNVLTSGRDTLKFGEEGGGNPKNVLLYCFIELSSMQQDSAN